MGRKIEYGPLPLINMAVGIPDGETPQGIIHHFAKRLNVPENQKYGAFHGKASFKQAIVDFYQRHYDVELDAEDEVCILYGTKMDLLHFQLVSLILGKMCYYRIQVIQII